MIFGGLQQKKFEGADFFDLTWIREITAANLCNQLGCKGLEKTRKRPRVQSIMKGRIGLVFLIQCCVVSPNERSLDSSLGFRLALNQKSIVLSVLSILTGHQRVFLGFFQTLSLQYLTDLLCIYFTDSGNRKGLAGGWIFFMGLDCPAAKRQGGEA